MGPRLPAGSSMRSVAKMSGRLPPETADPTPERKTRPAKSCSLRSPGIRSTPANAIRRTCALTCFSTSGYVRDGDVPTPPAAPGRAYGAGRGHAFQVSNTSVRGRCRGSGTCTTRLRNARGAPKSLPPRSPGRSPPGSTRVPAPCPASTDTRAVATPCVLNPIPSSATSTAPRLASLLVMSTSVRQRRSRARGRRSSAVWGRRTSAGDARSSNLRATSAAICAGDLNTVLSHKACRAASAAFSFRISTSVSAADQSAASTRQGSTIAASTSALPSSARCRRPMVSGAGIGAGPAPRRARSSPPRSTRAPASAARPRGD